MCEDVSYIAWDGTPIVLHLSYPAAGAAGAAGHGGAAGAGDLTAAIVH